MYTTIEAINSIADLGATLEEDYVSALDLPHLCTCMEYSGVRMEYSPEYVCTLAIIQYSMDR